MHCQRYLRQALESQLQGPDMNIKKLSQYLAENYNVKATFGVSKNTVIMKIMSCFEALSTLHCLARAIYHIHPCMGFPGYWWRDFPRPCPNGVLPHAAHHITASMC